MSKYIKIKINAGDGEAEASPTLEFSQESALWRADVLQDLMHDLETLYAFLVNTNSNSLVSGLSDE